MFFYVETFRHRRTARRSYLFWNICVKVWIILISILQLYSFSLSKDLQLSGIEIFNTYHDRQTMKTSTQCSKDITPCGEKNRIIGKLEIKLNFTFLSFLTFTCSITESKQEKWNCINISIHMSYRVKKSQFA